MHSYYCTHQEYMCTQLIISSCPYVQLHWCFFFFWMQSTDTSWYFCCQWHFSDSSFMHHQRQCQLRCPFMQWTQNTNSTYTYEIHYCKQYNSPNIKLWLHTMYVSLQESWMHACIMCGRRCTVCTNTIQILHRVHRCTLCGALVWCTCVQAVLFIDNIEFTIHLHSSVK